MALNEIQRPGWNLSLACTYPTTPASGDPVVFGTMPGVALTDEDASGNTTVATAGVFDLTVKGYDGSTNAAIAAGAVIYYAHAATPPLNVDDTGVVFGIVLAGVSSGATDVVAVKLHQI